MMTLTRRLRSLLVALAALAISSGLAFGAEPPASASWGLENAAGHAGKTVPVAGGDTTLGEDDEDGDEDEDESEDDEDELETDEADGVADEDGENCATDPTTLTEEELAAMRHGSISCWAAHQTEWPEEFANHGEWVRSWAKKDKGEDADAAVSRGNGKAKGRSGGE